MGLSEIAAIGMRLNGNDVVLSLIFTSCEAFILLLLFHATGDLYSTMLRTMFI